MDKLQEVKKYFIEEYRKKAKLILNEMLSMIPEIENTIKEENRLKNDFYKDYPGKRIYFAPKKPTTDEYKQVEKKLFEQMHKFWNIYYEASGVLKSSSGVQDINVVALTNVMYKKDVDSWRPGLVIDTFQEVVKKFLNEEFFTTKHGNIKLVDEKGQIDQKIIDDIEKTTDWPHCKWNLALEELKYSDNWDQAKRNIQERKRLCQNKVDESVARGGKDTYSSMLLEEFSKIEAKMDELEFGIENTQEKPKKAGDSLAIITEGKGKIAGKGGPNKSNSAIKE